MKFYGVVRVGTIKNCLNVGGSLGLINKGAKNAIIVVAWPDHGAGNDPEALGLALHHHGPTFINAYCQDATNLVDWDDRTYT